MDDGQRTDLLRKLADAIARRRLTAPARLLLDAIAPLGFLASQVAAFARPLTPLGRWREYLMALEDERSWRLLQSLVDERDS